METTYRRFPIGIQNFEDLRIKLLPSVEAAFFIPQFTEQILHNSPNESSTIHRIFPFFIWMFEIQVIILQNKINELWQSINSGLRTEY